MPRYEHSFLDDKGLKRLLSKIDSVFARKKRLEDEIDRSTGMDRILSERISKEIERATETEASIDTALKTDIRSETARAKAIETSLRSDVNALTTDFSIEKLTRERSDADLSERLDSAETALSSKVDSAFLDGQSILSGTSIDIASSDIKVLTAVSELPEEGVMDRLYRTPDNVLHMWTGLQYIDVGSNSSGSGEGGGKAYIVVKDELPEVGEQDVLVIKADTHTVFQWDGEAWREIGGSDKALRGEFEGHLTDPTAHAELFEAKADRTELEAHVQDKANPHGVTKEQLGLGNVDDTKDIDKPVSAAVQAALDGKVDKEAYEKDVEDRLVVYDDIKDDLDHPDAKLPLSANQGVVLDGKIHELDVRLQSFGSALLFKGVVSKTEDLDAIPSKNIGDCYQISSELDPDLTDKSHDGEMYAWDGSAWQKITAAATDMSSLIASAADVNRIINDYS